MGRNTQDYGLNPKIIRRQRRRQFGCGQRAGTGAYTKYVTSPEHYPIPKWQVKLA
ncbi:not available [Yersinia enterocolitica]|nr:not available [Yersinia enterocolitica]